MLTPLPANPTISASSELPTKPVYRRPDLRNVNQQAEKPFTFETELNQIGAVSESAVFRMPIGDESYDLTLELDIKRNRSLIRGIVKLRSGARRGMSPDLDIQPRLPFDSDGGE